MYLRIGTAELLAPGDTGSFEVKDLAMDKSLGQTCSVNSIQKHNASSAGSAENQDTRPRSRVAEITDASGSVDQNPAGFPTTENLSALKRLREIHLRL